MAFIDKNQQNNAVFDNWYVFYNITYVKYFAVTNNKNPILKMPPKTFTHKIGL